VKPTIVSTTPILNNNMGGDGTDDNPEGIRRSVSHPLGHLHLSPIPWKDP
jgi:hypothetical protein